VAVNGSADQRIRSKDLGPVTALLADARKTWLTPCGRASRALPAATLRTKRRAVARSHSFHESDTGDYAFDVPRRRRCAGREGTRRPQSPSLTILPLLLPRLLSSV